MDCPEQEELLPVQGKLLQSFVILSRTRM